MKKGKVEDILSDCCVCCGIDQCDLISPSSKALLLLVSVGIWMAAKQLVTCNLLHRHSGCFFVFPGA